MKMYNSLKEVTFNITECLSWSLVAYYSTNGVKKWFAVIETLNCTMLL